MTSVPRPFADAVLAYAQAGWPCIMPVPIEKAPPPLGFTGETGRDTDPIQLVKWAETHGDSSVALRMPDGVIGIDVDAYTKTVMKDGAAKAVEKHGAQTIAAAVERWGPLPATWFSSARGYGTSGIQFFRVAPGRYSTKLPGGDVEIIQRHHRYAVVWPSPHPDAGDIYRWYDPAGQPSDTPPKPDELAELPAAWLAGLREGATEAGPAAAAVDAGRLLLGQLVADDRPACAEITSAVLTAVDLLSNSDAGSRHDTATERTHHLVQLAAAGHPGLGRALPTLTGKWAELTAGEDRQDEWERMLLTSARKAVTAVGAVQVANDPCLLIGSFAVPAPAPRYDQPGDAPEPEPIEAPRLLHPLQVIGAHLFDPPYGLDQRLGEAVLERTWGVARYAYDANTWLMRGPDVWATRSDLAEWAVALVANLMPNGNPDAEKGSDARDQAERRKRLMSAGPAAAVAKKMRAVVSGGVHPSAIEIARLDSEPWLLWAGGIPWNLSTSRTEPVAAPVDPSTPHLHSAAVRPQRRPTPLWDAFLAAVWPDPELRVWALRVLSIAFTGYSNRALPILVGEQGRGKTQVVALLMSVLGSYAHAADPRLLGSADRAHASIIYALMGRRLSFIDEGPRDSKAGKESLKQLTGGGDLTGNQMNRNPVTFTPTHTLVLTANDEPMLTDPAVRSRVRLIPCEGDPDAIHTARKAIGHVNSPAWRGEAPGVLAAMMGEAAAWLADPDSALTVNAPESFRYRAEEIAAEQDPIATWLEDATEPHPTGTRSRELYEAFVGWCLAGNLDRRVLPNETKWGKELTARGYPPVHTREGKKRALAIRSRGSWIAPVTPVTPAAAEPVPASDSREPVTGCDGLVTGSDPNPSRSQPNKHRTPEDPVTGVTGSVASYAHVGARAHTREPMPNGGHAVTPVTPPSEANSSSTTEPPTEPPTVPAGAILCSRGDTQPTESDVAAVAAFAEQLTVIADPAPNRKSLGVEYHELLCQQDLRVEAATRGALTDKRGRDSEEVLRYFGEGEFTGSGTEPRLTWARFLEQRRPDREYAKKQQAAWEAGARLGRKHAAKPTPDADAQYARAGRNHDPDTFAAGYTAGITEHDQQIARAGGPRVNLPAVVTRAGDVRPLPLRNVPELLTAFGALAELTVDVEHTGYPVGHPDYQLRTIQLGNENIAVVYDADDPQQAAQARDLIAAAAILHAHSATADLVPLATAGVILDLDEAWARMHDTVIPALLADPASTGSDADGLKELARDLLGPAAVAPAADDQRAALFTTGKWLTNTKATTPVERAGWAQVDKRCTVMVRYAASDVLDAAAIAHHLPAVDEQLLDRERTAQRITARVAHRGLRIDGDQVDRLLPQHTEAREQAANALRAFDISNPGSDQQVAARLQQLGAPLTATKTGRPSVAKGVIEPLATMDGPIGELIRARLDYQHHDTVLTLFLEPYRVLVHHGDGRARPTVYTLGADTGRMSCVRPNLQQVPRQGGMRACITADPGSLLVSADFASVEIRVAAALSGDRNLKHMLANGIDLHWEIARQVFGPDATKADRYNVKRGVFGRLYGGGIPTLARQVGITESVAASMVDTLDAMTPELAAWSRHMRETVKAGHTQFSSYSGRIIHLPAAFPHKAPNYCIQGTARELLIDTLMRWTHTTWADAVLLPVHDEIVVMIKEADAAQATSDLVAAMETELYGVAIKAEASEPSFSWRDAA